MVCLDPRSALCNSYKLSFAVSMQSVLNTSNKHYCCTVTLLCTISVYFYLPVYLYPY